MFGLVNTGVFTTVSGKLNSTLTAPVAAGTIPRLNVPVVPAGGVPLSVAVPFPLSWILTQDRETESRLHESGVVSPLAVNRTWLGTPAVKFAPVHVVARSTNVQPAIIGVGAGVTLIVNCCSTAP